MKLNNSMKATFIVLIFLSSTISAFGSKKADDTTFIDLTSSYRVEMKYAPKNKIDYRVAIIPRDSIGKKNIKWDFAGYPNESEMEFENEMLQCSKEQPEDNGNTIKTKKYCERQYNTAGAGSWWILYYYSFIRKNELVIATFNSNWHHCEYSDDYAIRKECKKETKEQQRVIKKFVNKLMPTIKYNRIK